MSTAADHCQDLVRQGAKDRYLASLFAPDAKRSSLFALYAFDVEIARICHVVSEPQIGLIRQQWWLDTLDSIYAGAAPAHPVAEELARAIELASLPKHALRNLVLAREFDLYSDAMLDLQALETYLGETSSAVIQMAALILAGPEAQSSAEAAGLAGVAFGRALLLSEQPQRHLPPGMEREAAIAHVRKRVAEARELRHTVAAAALPAFLPVSLTESYLSKARPSQFRRQLTLWLAARRNRF